VSFLGRSVSVCARLAVIVVTPAAGVEPPPSVQARRRGWFFGQGQSDFCRDFLR